LGETLVLRSPLISAVDILLESVWALKASSQ